MAASSPRRVAWLSPRFSPGVITNQRADVLAGPLDSGSARVSVSRITLARQCSAMFGCTSGISGGAAARRFSNSAFCCSSSLILAFDGRLVHSVLDGVENPLDAPLDLLKNPAGRFNLGTPLVVLTVALLGIGAHNDRHSFWR